LKIAVFPAQPKDLSSALALAQEAEASNDRSAFGARHSEEKMYRPNNQRQADWKSYEQNQSHGAMKKNPHFVRTQGGRNNQGGSFKQRPHTTKPHITKK